MSHATDPKRGSFNPERLREIKKSSSYKSAFKDRKQSKRTEEKKPIETLLKLYRSRPQALQLFVDHRNLLLDSPSGLGHQ